MKSILRLALAVSVMFQLVGCGGPTIDGKNYITYGQSVTEILADLSQEEGLQFMTDLATVSLDSMSGPGEMNLESIQNMSGVMLKELDGKSVSDVRKMAKAIRETN